MSTNISDHTHYLLLYWYSWDRAQELLIADPSVSKTIGSSYECLPLLTAVVNKVSIGIHMICICNFEHI